jgi:hypothetical protein
MPTIRLKIKYNINSGLVISPDELMEQYLFGIPTCTTDGRSLNMSAVRNAILAAQTRIETLFSIKLKKQVVYESRDFVREDFDNWGAVKVMYPIMQVEFLKGYINNVAQITYPKPWLNIKRDTTIANYRNLFLMPNADYTNGSGVTFSSNAVVFSGVAPHLGWYGKKVIPNYWRIQYITGWDNPPADLVDLIAKIAAINVLSIIGDILYGVGLGSISISLDGVSQNTPLTRSGKYGLFTGRMQLYTDEINQTMPDLKANYAGIAFMVL